MTIQQIYVKAGDVFAALKRADITAEDACDQLSKLNRQGARLNAAMPYLEELLAKAKAEVVVDALRDEPEYESSNCWGEDASDDYESSE